MSVPPEVLQRMMAASPGGPAGAPQGQPGAAPGQLAAGGAPGQQPSASPMAVPQEKKGLKAGAMSNLHIAQNMVEQALTAFDPDEDADTYNACLDVLKKLARVAGKNDSRDLVPAQIARMVGELPQAGGGTDMQKMLRAQMMGGSGRPQGGAQPPQPAMH